MEKSFVSLDKQSSHSNTRNWDNISPMYTLKKKKKTYVFKELSTWSKYFSSEIL